MSEMLSVVKATERVVAASVRGWWKASLIKTFLHFSLGTREPNSFPSGSMRFELLLLVVSKESTACLFNANQQALAKFFAPDF